MSLRWLGGLPGTLPYFYPPFYYHLGRGGWAPARQNGP